MSDYIEQNEKLQGIADSVRNNSKDEIAFKRPT
jgi:hypothetical protein